ncbi:MAG: hypothetical protein ACXABY_13115 [Candidatus Thorarchaeota archaeon]|jgi:hypothetical protein
MIKEFSPSGLMPVQYDAEMCTCAHPHGSMCECVTSDTEVDDEEAVCAECDRVVNLYNEEIYHRYNDGGTILEWICKECVT